MATRKTVDIAGVTVGDGHPTCLVAEIGVNHLGDLARAKTMIRTAHDAGAHLIKLQTYVAEKRYDAEANPKGAEFIKNLKAWQFSKETERELWAYARSIGAKVFTSVFDLESVDFADELGSPAFKLAAFELVNTKLVEKIAEKGKPVIYSRGMASLEELDRVNDILEAAGCPYIILHTISSYPLEKKDSHLRMIHTLRGRYDVPVGHSDHTHGTAIPPLAVAAGANMIEKHYTDRPKYRESDNFFSITEEELREIAFKVRQVDSYMGSGAITRIEAEDYMWDFRRHS